MHRDRALAILNWHSQLTVGAGAVWSTAGRPGGRQTQKPPEGIHADEKGFPPLDRKEIPEQRDQIAHTTGNALGLYL